MRLCKTRRYVDLSPNATSTFVSITFQVALMQMYYLWDNWAKSSSNSSSSWSTFTSGITGVALDTTPAVEVPPAMSSCQLSTRCKLSFSASPWPRRPSSLEEQISLSGQFSRQRTPEKIIILLTQFHSQAAWHASDKNGTDQQGQQSLHPSKPAKYS